jgi:hypothetical protein
MAGAKYGAGLREARSQIVPLVRRDLRQRPRGPARNWETLNSIVNAGYP